MKPIFRLVGVPRALGLAGAIAFAGCTGAVENKSTQEPGAGSMTQPGGGGAPSGGGGPSTGSPGGGGSPSTGGGGTPMTTPGGTPVTTPGLNAGTSPLRRLTARQYLNTVRDLLKMPDAEAALGPGSLPSDGSIAERFSSNAEGAIKGLEADKYADSAELLARKAVTNLAGLVPCALPGNADCATQFITQFGRRAFRRPLAPVEVERYKKAFTAGGDFSNGIRLVVQAFLQSPKFLYLVEPIPADGVGRILALDSWAMASRLSYFLLNTLPDEQLFAAAEKGELSNADQVGKAATRLMADPRFKETIKTFHDEWLDLGEVRGADKNAMMFPMWNDALKGALDEQNYKFIEGVFADGAGKADALLTGTTAFLKGPLYELYGLSKPAGAAGDAWAKVELDPKQRGGLLTQAGFMAGLAHEDRTSFILRGQIVRESLLCTDIPPPPPGLNASEENIPATATARERSEMHRVKPECASCHSLFDPVGFAFETYDAVGRFRAMDATGKPIDSTLDMTDTGSLNGRYANALDLMKKMAGSDEFATCLSKQWLRFALGREVDDAGTKGADLSSLLAGRQALKDSGKIVDLLAALARSDAFRHQKVLP